LRREKGKSFLLELGVVGDILELRVVEVGGVSDVAFESREERNEDGGITVAMVASADAGHHLGYLNFIVLADDNALLNCASAQKGHLMDDRAKRGNG